MSEIPEALKEAREFIKAKKMRIRAFKYEDNPNLAKYNLKKNEEQYNLIENPISKEDYINNILYYKNKFINMTAEELKQYKKLNKLEKLVAFEEYKLMLYSKSKKKYYLKNKERFNERDKKRYQENKEYYKEIIKQNREAKPEQYKKMAQYNSQRYYYTHLEKKKENYKKKYIKKYKYSIIDIHGNETEIDKLKDICKKLHISETHARRLINKNELVSGYFIIRKLNDKGNLKTEITINKNQ